MTTKIHTDYGYLPLDYDPSKYTSPGRAARGLAAALRKLDKRMGGNGSGIWIKSPAESKEHGYVDVWHVCWEDGPYDWAVGTFISGPWGHCEPYWGFDLAFYGA